MLVMSVGEWCVRKLRVVCSQAASMRDSYLGLARTIYGAYTVFFWQGN